MKRREAIRRYRDEKAMGRMLWLLHASRFDAWGSPLHPEGKTDEDLLVEARLFELIGDDNLGRLIRGEIEMRRKGA